MNEREKKEKFIEFVYSLHCSSGSKWRKCETPYDDDDDGSDDDGYDANIFRWFILIRFGECNAVPVRSISGKVDDSSFDVCRSWNSSKTFQMSQFRLGVRKKKHMHTLLAIQLNANGTYDGCMKPRCWCNIENSLIGWVRYLNEQITSVQLKSGTHFLPELLFWWCRNDA